MESVQNKLKSPCKVGVFKLVTILALVILLLTSTLMMAKLNAEVAISAVPSTSQSNIDSTSDTDVADTNMSGDYSYLAHKYFSLFEQNPDGTASLDLRRRSVVVVDEQDKEALVEYASAIEKINEMIAEGLLFKGADGNYYAVGSETNSRDLNGGNNAFWVRFWWFIPVGYHIELSATNALIFGAVSAFFASGSMLFVNDDINSFGAFLWKNADGGFGIYYELFEEFWNDWRDTAGWLIDILLKHKSLMATIELVMSTGGVVSLIIKVIVNIVLNLIWGSTGIPFLTRGILCAVSDSNTVVVEPDLIFWGSHSWDYRY